MSNGKVMIVNLIAGVIKKIWCNLNETLMCKNEQIFS